MFKHNNDATVPQRIRILHMNLFAKVPSSSIVGHLISNAVKYIFHDKRYVDYCSVHMQVIFQHLLFNDGLQ